MNCYVILTTRMKAPDQYHCSRADPFTSLLAALALYLATAFAARGQAQTAAPAPAPAASPATNAVTTAGDDIIPIVAFDSVPLRDAVTTLARQAGLNAEFDPALLKQVVPEVTVKWTQVTARQALRALLDNYDWQMTQSPDSAAHINVKDPNAVGLRRTIANLWEKSPTNGAPGDVVVSAIVFDSVPVPDAIRALARQAGLNIQFDPALRKQKAADGTLVWSSTVTDKWERVTARDTLLALLNQVGWQVTQLPGNPIFRIGPKSP